MQEPSSITLSSSTIVLTTIGQRIRIAATVLDQDSKVIADATVFFRSGDVNIATVSDNGLVTAAAMGTAQITVSSGYASATATVTVSQEAGRIVITPPAVTLERVGQTVQLEAVVYDTGSSAIPGASVVWSSSHPEYATIDANGLVTALSSGTTQITATSGGVSTSRPVFVVLAQPAARIVLNISEATLTTIGQNLKLDALVYDVDGVAIPGAQVTWSSSLSSVATVGDDGLVSAVSDGTTLVTATSGNVSTFATIHVVVAREAVSIIITPSSATLTSVGQPLQLEAVVYDIAGAPIPGALVEWESSGPAVAAVSEDGLVTAVSNGVAQITASSGEVTASAMIVVGLEAGSITVTPSSATLTSVGQTLQLEAVVYDTDGAVISDAPVAWSSSDPLVAAVSENGLVTAVSNGSVQITASSGGASETAEVSVMQAASRIVITPPSSTFESVGATVQLEAVVYDMDGAPIPDAQVAWSNIDPAVATVDANGLVTAVSNGSAQITASSGDVSAIAEITVMQAASRISITPPSSTLESVGATVQLEAVVYDMDGAPIPDAQVAWSNIDPAVATVDANGLVTAVSNGSAQITASSGDVSAIAEITVMQAASRISITPPSAALGSVGATVQLEAVVYDMDGAPIPDAQVAWSNIDPAVATVDANGLVTAVSNGSAQITASSGDVSAIAEITVMQAASRISITTPSAALGSVGATIQLEAVVYDAEGAAIPDAPVMWSSDDPEVATVDSTGLATGVGAGETTITATSGEVSGTARLTVTRPPPPPPPPPPPQTGPDLIVSSPSVTDSTPETGGSFTLSVTVRNNGDRSAAATTLRYYQSSDATISRSDIGVGTDSVGALAASGTSAESVSLSAPSSAGTYYYGACVDAVTGESNTTNNCSSAKQVTVSEPPPRPELRAIAVGVVIGRPAPGGTFSLWARVINEGQGESAATTMRILHSIDNDVIEPTDMLVRSYSVGALSAGVRSDLKMLDLTASLTPGEYYYGVCVDVVTGESNTDNNCANHGPVIVTGPQTSPDLTISSFQANEDSLTSGESFTLSATVSNNGDGAAAATTLRYYRSSDAHITTSDTQVGTNAVGALSAFGTSNESVGLTAPSSAGTYYYGACVDAVTGESHTSNNCSGSVQVTVSEPPPQTSPDLTVGSPSVTDGTPDTGESFTLSATVSNVGDGSSAATTLRYYRSSDASITTSDAEEGTDSVGTLAAAGSSRESVDLKAPSTAGTYYYGACVDAVTGESSTSNNCSASVQVTVSEPPPQTSPDLTVGSPSVTDSTPDTGGSFTLSATVSNVGDGSSAATTLRFYQSSDSSITTSDTHAGTGTVEVLSAGATSSSIGSTVIAPSSAGTYYYGACVDAVTGESHTSNNCSGSVQVTVSEPPPQTSPDLTVGSPSVTDGTPDTGESFTLSATVSNVGDGSSAATTLRYYRSSDASITTSDAEEGTDSVGTLAAAGSSRESVDLKAPSTAGTYYYGACVDAVTGESSTSNNCSASVQVTVSEPPPQTSPDLTVGSPSVTDSTPDTGGSFTLSATVSNDGDGSAEATTLRYYRSLYVPFTTFSIQETTDAVGPLAASGTSKESVGLTAPSTAGTYYYGACVDAVTGESDTSNNCSSAVQVTVTAATPGPDLKVYAFVAFTNLGGTPPGGSIQLSAGVENEGDESSAATTLRFYQSSDSSITTSDTHAGTGTVEVLSAGATSSSIGSTVIAPSSAGTYYYGACVDEVTDESDTTNNCSGSVPVEVTE